MSGPGTPSETPGHHALSEQQRDLIVTIRLLGDGCARTLEVLQESGICDPRWLAMARTELQKGAMFAVRAVTKPEFF
jgi:hypothetical protein